MAKDQFGNHLDDAVGYARGSLLSDSGAEVRRLSQAGRVAAEYVAAKGMDKIAVCTGNLRKYPVSADDLSQLCEEWVGPGLFGEELRQTTIAHLGGQGHEAVAAVNRTSAGIIATILAWAHGQPVVSIVPAGDRSHASVKRGAALAQVPVVEVHDLAGLEHQLQQQDSSLLVITTVTSELAMLDDQLVADATKLAQRHGCVVCLDEAYGARYRPVLHAGAMAMDYGADLIITNSDKAGLSGPRAGVFCGTAQALVPVQAKMSELGMEARAPIAAGVLRSLQGFTPELLRQEVADGKQLSQALIELLGRDYVSASALGPKLHEYQVMQLVLNKAGLPHSERVPAEVTAVVGMQLLKRHGVVTVNTHGQPGGRVSVRLKPTLGALQSVGGAQVLAQGLVDAIDTTAAHLHDTDWFRQQLFGEQQ